MFNHELFATSLARAVDVMRNADSVEQQKAALRALVALAANASATIRCYDGELSVDDVGIPPDLAHVGTLTGRMAAHGVAEIAIGRKAEPAELLALLRGLAEPAGGPTVKDRLFSAKSKRIWVLLAEPEDAGPVGRTSVSNLFDGEQGPVRGIPKKKSAFKKEEEEALAAWNEMHDDGATPSTIKDIDLGITLEPGEEPSPVPAPVPRAPEPEAPLPELPVAADSRLGRALMAVARRPYAPNVLDLLTAFVDEVLAVLRQQNVTEAVRATAMVAQLEAGAPDGTPRNSYRIALRRILQGETLMQLAKYIADPELGADTAAIFTRAGAEGTEVLLQLLARTESSRERKTFMSALKAMPTGHDLVVQMLGHHQWFVARNVAELAGEMRLEIAVPELARLTAHEDTRVRRAAALALAKIATPAAFEPLLRTLREGNAETRALVASLTGPGQASMFTNPLVALLETEEEPDVLRETCLALGRFGTPEAVQALERAQKAGGMFSKRARAIKEAAEAGLKKVRKG